MTTPFPFVPSQILTAGELNSITNLPSSTKTANYVLTLANLGSRVVMNSAGSTSITVNTSIFSAGDIVQLSNIGAGICTVTAGTATVSSAGPLAIPQYGGGQLVFSSTSAAIYFPSAVTVAAPAAGALEFIDGAALTGASVTFSNCFSATYDSYFITMTGCLVTSGTSQVNFRLGGSTTLTYNTTYQTPGSGQTNLSSGTNASVVVLAGTNTTEAVSMSMTVVAPFLAINTSMVSFQTQATQFHRTQLNDQSTSSYSNFTMSMLASSFSAGEVKIYGYTNS
jgi:hypothetical protein